MNREKQNSCTGFYRNFKGIEIHSLHNSIQSHLDWRLLCIRVNFPSQSVSNSGRNMSYFL